MMKKNEKKAQEQLTIALQDVLKAIEQSRFNRLIDVKKDFSLMVAMSCASKVIHELKQ